MSRIAYVNGRYAPLGASMVAVEERGLQFADGVYEVVKAVDGVPRDLDRHMARLARSLAELGIAMPMPPAALRAVIYETLRRNGLARAVCYVQIGRGVAPRAHGFPRNVRPSLIVTVRRAPFPAPKELEQGVAVISLPDERWARCDIKSISLLPNVLAKQKAAEAGAREAWLLDAQGFITEGSSANSYIVDGAGRLVTRPLGPAILGGVTRAVLLELARADGLEVVERAFTLEEAQNAREAFLTSTSSLVLPVTRIDARPIADGMPGPVTRRLLAIYRAHVGL